MGCELYCCISKVLYPMYICNACVRDVRVGLSRSTQALSCLFCGLDVQQISDRTLGLGSLVQACLPRKRGSTAVRGTRISLGEKGLPAFSAGTRWS